jgi:glycosyltransferase involved in cell wall biosynthesis
MNNKQKYLFVISGDGSVIGGHMISTLSLANALQLDGSKAGVIMAPFQVDFPDVNQASIEFYYSPLPHSWLLAYIKRSFNIAKVVSSTAYNILVAADYESVLHSLPVLILTGMPLIQIHANEKVTHFRPVCVPGIIVFSDSVVTGYEQQYKIPKLFMHLSSGRINFNYFASYSKTDRPKRMFSKRGIKILIISRLVTKKIPTFTNIFDQLKKMGDKQVIQLIIIGGGEVQMYLEQCATATLPFLHPESSITFLGALRVTPNILNQADIVVGQGRTVIEAIASGVPAAVSGEDGYKGTITSENFLSFRRTDFSGRTINSDNTLEKDLKELSNFLLNDFENVYTLARKYFDTSVGIEAIETLLARITHIFPSSISRRWAYLKAFTLHFWLRLKYYFKKLTTRVGQNV